MPWILHICVILCSTRSQSTDPTHGSMRHATTLFTTPNPGTAVVETPLTIPTQNLVQQPIVYQPQPVPHILQPVQPPLPQETVHKDAQFSAQVAPPPYDVAIAYPSYTSAPVGIIPQPVTQVLSYYRHA